MLGGHALVGLAPPHGVFGFGIADDELVLRTATGVLAGFDDQRTVLGELAFAAGDRMLDQLRGDQVSNAWLAEVCNPLVSEREDAGVRSITWHTP